ncbi:MAG: DUF2080 family transposase-associated protein [Nanoarchaeota archaeon]|nr:DUF2080 family transposase-associated protein [Nanoarchaeota archaeon]
MEQAAIKEQLVKTVVKSGNGGAVWVPKAWLGEEVIVILPQKPRLEVRERVLRLLEPYLKDVLAVGIYGSYARKEQRIGSDVDVIVVTTGNVPILIKEKRMEILSIPLETLKKAIHAHPSTYFQPVREAEPLINGALFEELRHIRPSKEGIRAFIKETREHLKSSRELIELDRLDGEILQSSSVLYSTMLRLKGAYILRCALKAETFSSKGWKRWLLRGGLTGREFEMASAVYRAVRDSLSLPQNVPLPLGEKAVNILEREARLLEDSLGQ